MRTVRHAGRAGAPAWRAVISLAVAGVGLLSLLPLVGIFFTALRPGFIDRPTR